MKYLDNNGLTYLVQKIKVWLSSKVDEGDIPQEVFVWDGQSSSSNSSNLTLFQEIYNAWASNKKVLVIVGSSDKTYLLSRTIRTTNRLTIYDFHTEVTKSGTKTSYYSYAYEVRVTVGDNGVVTAVSAVSSDTTLGNIISEETDPIFEASPAYGITADNINSWNSKAESSAIPTKVSQLTNDSGYQTSSQVQTIVNNAVGQITSIDFQVVSSLPSTGVKGVIYLISNSGSGQNIYDEYIWVNNKFEFIGTTAVDLSDYLKKSDAVAITNDEIDTIVA